MSILHVLLNLEDDKIHRMIVKLTWKDPDAELKMTLDHISFDYVINIARRQKCDDIRGAINTLN